jgi:hypothetical protein
MDGKIFSRWANKFNHMQIWKFGREIDVKAWVLLDKSSTHVCLTMSSILSGTWMDSNGGDSKCHTLMLTLRYNYKCKIEGKEKEKYVEWVLEDSKVRKDWLQTSASRI